jgi:hypothetical protein
MPKKEKPYQNVFTSLKRDCLFQEQFVEWDPRDWNKDMPDFFRRLNRLKDDRAFVILAHTVLEYEIDRFLRIFIPKPDIILNNITFFGKVNLIRAFQLIPPDLIKIAEVINNIRNCFAHELNVDSFEEAENTGQMSAHISEMKRLWKKYKYDMNYYQEGGELRLMYKDLWSVALEGFRVYELNIKLFRQETEKPEFINQLKELAIDLRAKRAAEYRKKRQSKL